MYRALAVTVITFLILINVQSTWPIDDGRVYLEWDPSITSNIAGYRVHFGTASRTYSSHINAGLSTSFRVNGLKNSTTYYFAVTTQNYSEEESGFSNEVSFTVPPAPIVMQISATSGPAGARVTIQGKNLDPGAVVQFNGVAAHIISMSSTTIVAVIPSGASSGPLTVTTAGGGVIAAQFTITLPVSKVGLFVPNGGTANYDTIGPDDSLKTGYALAVPTDSNTAPYGTAVFSYRQNGVVVSEVGIPAVATTRAVRIFVDNEPKGSTNDGGMISIHTGFAIANLDAGPADLHLLLRDSEGNVLSAGAVRLDQGCQIARFIDQLAPYLILPETFTNSGLGSLEITSNQLISVMALRLTINQRGELLFTSLPIADLTAPASSKPLYFPQMAAGGGYQTSLILLNTSTSLESGTIQFRSKTGMPLTVGLRGESAQSSQFTYSIAPGGIFQLITDEFQSVGKTGWIKVIPDLGHQAPVGTGVFTLTRGGVMISQSGIPVALPTTNALIYVDKAAGHDTGLAIVNTGDEPSQIAITLRRSDGVTDVATDRETINLASNEQDSSFAWQVIGDPAAGFTGVLELTSTSEFAALTLRALTNERGDFLFTIFPTVDATGIPSVPIVFPQVANGGGYKTDFLFLNPGGSGSNISLEFRDDAGKPIAIGK